MIFSENVKIPLKDIDETFYIKDIGILEMLENTASHHSDMQGYGVTSVENTGLAWILMDWKVKVLKRPKYGEELTVNTWARFINGSIKKHYTYRDFEVLDSLGNLCVIATSKWVIINMSNGRITEIGDSILDAYGIEDKSVFGEQEVEKLKIYQDFKSIVEYKINRSDVDFIGHVHNLYYLNLAYNALPEDVYKLKSFDNFRISYKREIKLGETVKCKYSYNNGQHIITIFNEEETKVHSIIELK
ncbi:MAG: hypothetical protein IKV94_05585 [Clostridia bacterium]|nr:hypothetical protein [Clostridia bacterium]